MMPTPPFIRENSERRDYKWQKVHAELPLGTVLQSAALNRLLTAALVNYRFCSLLLSDPIQAATNGYNGETFELAPEEIQLLRTIKASSLRDFAMQLLTKDITVEKTWLETKSTAFLGKTYAAA
jgi:hypothetical protein